MAEKYLPDFNRPDKDSYLFDEEDSDPSRATTNAEIINRKYSSSSTVLREIDFLNLPGYQNEEVKKDIELISKIRSRFQAQNARLAESDEEIGRMEARDKRSQATEKIVTYQGEESEWFGHEAFLIKTTEYDDFVNGVDIVLEFNLENPEEIGLEDSVHRVALAIDATSSQVLSQVEEKISNCVKKIRGETKSEVKYFISQVDTDFQQPLERVVPVVVGLDAKNSNKMINLVGRLISLGSKKERSEQEQREYQARQAAIAEHPIQAVFLEEILFQLDLYERILRQEGINRDLYQQIIQLQRIFENILAKKKEDGIKSDSLNSDHAWITIQGSVAGELIKLKKV